MTRTSAQHVAGRTLTLMMTMGRAMIEDEDANGLNEFLANPIM